MTNKGNFWGDDAVEPIDVTAAKQGGDVAAPAPSGGDFWGKDAVDVGSAPARIKTPMSESLLRGGAQGITLGHADELVGLGEGAYNFATDPNAHGLEGLKAAYDKARDESRANFDQAQTDHPIAYGVGALGGGIATAAVPGLGALNAATKATLAGRLGTAALGGALTGEGLSRHDPTKGLDEAAGLVKDTGEGALTGLAVQGAFEAAPHVLRGAKALGKKALSAAGGVPEKNIDAYLKNPEAIRNAPSFEEIKDLADAGVAAPRAEAEQARFAAQQAKESLQDMDRQLTEGWSGARESIRDKLAQRREALQDAWHAKLDELRAKSAVPLEHAQDLVDRLGSEKGTLGRMSDQAEEALANAGGSFRKQDLLDAIDEIGARQGNALIGDEATDAAKSFYEMRQRMVDSLPDEIPYPQMRNVLKQLRADVKRSGGFNQSAGEFNSTLTGMRKEATGKISDALKQSVPDYAADMDQMMPRSRLLEEMDPHFGEASKALSSLQTVANESSPRARYLEDLLTRYANATGNKDLLDKLQSFKDARRVLASKGEQETLRRALPEYRQVQRAEDALKQIAPDRTRKATQLALELVPDRKALASANDSLADALQANETFKGWSPQTSASRLLRVMGGGPRAIEDIRAIQQLAERTGTPFEEMLKNRAVADSFEKGFTHGSRNVNLWAMIGRFLGGHGGKYEHAMTGGGAALGGLIDRAGPKMTQKGLDALLAIQNSRFAPVLERAAERGQSALAATHAILLKKEPAYRALFTNPDQEGNPSP